MKISISETTKEQVSKIELSNFQKQVTKLEGNFKTFLLKLSKTANVGFKTNDEITFSTAKDGLDELEEVLNSWKETTDSLS